jgi:UDP-glucose 4-epimerase
VSYGSHKQLKLVVTGGAGFIGSNLANALVRLDLEQTKEDKKSAKETNPESRKKEDRKNDNYIERNPRDNSRDAGNINEVIAVDDLSLGSPSNLSPKVSFVEGSVMDEDLIETLTKGCDYIFHQAALSSSPMFIDDPRKGLGVNVMGFMNVMESAKRNKVKKVIYASSSSLYNGLPGPYKETAVISPKTFYESSFLCREITAKTYYLEHGVNSVGLRYFSVYGPSEKHKGKFANNISQFIWDIQKGKNPVVYGDGSQSRDFTFVDDVVQANILAMIKEEQQQKIRPYDYGENESNNHEAPYNIYNIGTGTETSFNQVIQIINKLLGTKIRPIYVNNPIHNYVQHTRADISKAKSELGYEPKWTDMEAGIRELLTYSAQLVT